MIAALSGLARRSTRLLFALALSVVFGLPREAPAQDATNRHDDIAGARLQNSPTLSDLPATLAEKYPTVRALVLTRGNCTIFEYYRKNIDAGTQSPVYSITKSLLSILVGIAIDEGYLRLDQKLPEIVPEAFDENVDPRVRDITVRDVLTKTEGFAETGPGDFKVSGAGTELWRWMLNRPMKYPPGTHFRYDGVGSDMLSVVLSKAIKQDATGFARQKLLDPLNITNYNWPSDSEGYLHGEKGLSLTARDMAKIGLLYLHHGRWNGNQIVSEAYVQDSTTRHSDGDRRAAYGYQWWVNKSSNNLEAFSALGYLSQSIYVVPQRDLVAAVSADGIAGGSQSFLNGVVIPAEANSAASVSCIAELEQGHRQ